MKFSDQYEALGKVLTQKFRDENFDHYQQMKDDARSSSLSEYHAQKRNPNLDPNLQKLKDERFEFLNELSDHQIAILDRLILSLLDLTAFSVLKEVEEHLDENESIGLTIQGEKVEKISPEFLSGTLFGEYFSWVEVNSRYGKFQH